MGIGIEFIFLNIQNNTELESLHYQAMKPRLGKHKLKPDD